LITHKEKKKDKKEKFFLSDHRNTFKFEMVFIFHVQLN